VEGLLWVDYRNDSGDVNLRVMMKALRDPPSWIYTVKKVSGFPVPGRDVT
jgi:hypothetical protein